MEGVEGCENREPLPQLGKEAMGYSRGHLTQELKIQGLGSFDSLILILIRSHNFCFSLSVKIK